MASSLASFCLLLWASRVPSNLLYLRDISTANIYKTQQLTPNHEEKYVTVIFELNCQLLHLALYNEQQLALCLSENLTVFGRWRKKCQTHWHCNCLYCKSRSETTKNTRTEEKSSENINLTCKTMTLHQRNWHSEQNTQKKQPECFNMNSIAVAAALTVGDSHGYK